MVEMLGTLAIIGILSMVGIKAFNAGMTQHRANELLNEAQKRAVVVAAQIMAGGDNLSVAEFKNPEGYTFGVEKNFENNNQFHITVDGVAAEVCQKIKTMVDSGTIVRLISNSCDKITFNNDLSQKIYPSDYSQDISCESGGFTWCTKGDGGVGSRCSENTDCCMGIVYDSQCQSCDSVTGEVSNKEETHTCYFGDDHIVSRCYAGVCLNPNITSTTKCLTNADCGGVGSGYYCRYESYDENTYCTKEGKTAIGCANTPLASCINVGTCTLIGAINKQKVKDFGYVTTTTDKMNWWSASNWCQAQGRNLIPVEDFQCFVDGRVPPKQYVENSGLAGTCCSKGKTCTGYGDGDWVTSGAPFSPIIFAFVQKFNRVSNFWLGSKSSSCYVFNVFLKNARLYNMSLKENNLLPLCR